MIDESMKLKLLAGQPIQISDVCLVHPLTINEIAYMGYESYDIALTNLIAEPKDFNIPNEMIQEYDLDTFKVICDGMNNANDEYRNLIKKSIQIFVREDVMYFNDVFCIGDINDSRILSRDNYEEFKRIIKLQNCIDKKQGEFDNLANSKAEEIAKKILKGRQSIEGKEKIYFDDLISVLAANGNGLNIKNVWDLTMYQFNNQFSRMKMIEDYDINIRSILAGADANQIELKHYIRPIDYK